MVDVEFDVDSMPDIYTALRITEAERDINLIARASRGIVVIDDVVSTGGTLLALEDLLEEVRDHLNRPLPGIAAAFCVAQEGDRQTLPSYPVHALTRLPAPEFV